MIQTHDEAVVQSKAKPVARNLLIAVTCGTAGSLLFTTTYTLDGALRVGYNPLQQAISALSLGPGGWVQQVNFIVFGIIILATTIAWRAVLKGGRGATWFPIFRSLLGVGLIIDGFFSQDAAPGYPPGVGPTAVTLHGTIHLAFACISITAMAFACFVLARRFAVEPEWRGWKTYSIVSGILIIVFIATFGAANAQHSNYAGLLERLSIATETLWGLLLIIKLWRGAGFTVTSTSQQAMESHAH